jgi:hypothetical protein
MTEKKPVMIVKVEQLAEAAFLRARGIDPAGPMQLEMWPDVVRAIPNDYARCALFSVRNKREPRLSMEGAVLFHMDKAVRVTYTGVELRSDDDELVWMQILEYAKHHALDEAVEFNLHQLCRDLDWTVNGRNYDRLRASISRLKANEIKVENEQIGRGQAISLIREYEYDAAGESAGSRYRVWIDKRLVILFAGNRYTRVEWREYRGLRPVARRLYDYVASHRQPFPLMLESFWKLCRSDCADKHKWAAMVREACRELEGAGMVKKAWVANQRVYCER